VTGNIPYSTIAATYPGEQLWDANAQAAYISVDLAGTNNDRFISIDNEQTIFAKMKYLHDKGVGGLIIWELGGGYRTNAPAGQKDLLLQAVKAAYTGGEPPLEDTTPPVVSLVFPTPGASLNNSVWLEANATDNVRIASVAFTLNGTPVGAPVEFTPYRMKMNTWTYTNGQYELAATAKDLAGNTATATVTVTINNQGTPPVPVEKVVYDNQLRNPFMNTSWGSTIDFSNTSVSKDGSNVIRVAYGNGGGLDFLSGTWANMINIDPQTYDTLKFDVYSSSEFPLEVGFYVSASTNVTPPANQWRTFAMAIPRVPFARFYFRNATPQNRTVYFDNIRFEGPGVQTSVDPPIGGVPADFSLGQNYPNPFNPSTRISFTLPVSIHATLRVFDLSGKLVATLVDGELQAGVHEVEFNSSMVRIGSSSGLASGVYIYQLVAGSFQDTRKLVLMK